MLATNERSVLQSQLDLDTETVYLKTRDVSYNLQARDQSYSHNFDTHTETRKLKNTLATSKRSVIQSQLDIDTETREFKTDT